MKKELLLTILSSIALILLQVFWINSMYQKYENQYTEKINKAFFNAIEKEVGLRSMHIEQSKHSTIFIKSVEYMSEEERAGYKGDTIDLVHLEQNGVARNVSELLTQIKQDGLLAIQKPPILSIIDSLFQDELYDLNINHYITLRNKEKQIIDSVGNAHLQSHFQIIINQKPIGTKGLLYIQIESGLPNDTILSQMLYSLIASTLIVAIVLGCLIFQLTVIRKKNEILKNREASVNGIVHDLKSPLNALITLTCWLRKNESDYKKKQLMNEVIKRAKHLTTQIESILICARGTTQHIILQRTKINIEEVIKTAIGNICVDLSSKPHSIEIVNESPNIECLADQLDIENAIKNLIENALKYSNDGVKIQIKIVEISQGIQIEVKDNGWGIAHKYQKKIFSQYYQVPRETSQIQKGYGIGLSYVKYIIQAHGGKIRLRSRENEGSTFTFYISK